MTINTGKFHALLFSSVLVVGCGGSSNSSSSDVVDDPVNQAPTISLAGVSAAENTDVTLSATASDDASGLSFAWSQTSGTDVTLTGDDTDTVTFTAPAVTADEVLSFSVTVTDAGGLTATATADVDVTANILNLTLDGLVTDSPIANANVIVTIGDQSFSVTADENGAYSVEVAVDDSYSSELMMLAATGPEDNSIVSLSSIAGSFQDALDASGDDGTVDRDELFAVNVTNVSTATSVVLELANGGAITSADELQTAISEADTSLILPMATVIKLVIDYAQDNSVLALPEGVSDTLDLITNAESMQAYLETAQTQAPDEFDQALNEILTDDELIDTDVDENTLATTYYVIGAEGRFGGDPQIVLNADGTGTETTILRVDSDTGVTNLTWTTSDAGIELSYVNPVVSTGFTIIDDQQVQQNFSTTGSTFAIVSQLGGNITFSRTNTTRIEYPNGEFPTEVQTGSPFIIKAVTQEAIASAQNLLEMGVEYALFIPSETEAINYPDDPEIITAAQWWTGGGPNTFRYWYNYAVFSGDPATGGSVTLRSPEVDYRGNRTFLTETTSWTINSDGELVIELPSEGDGEGAAITYTILDVEDNSTPLVSVEVAVGEDRIVESGNILKRVSTIDASNIAGIYSLDWGFLVDGNDRFWFELYEDGTGYSFSTGDRNGDGTLSEDEITAQPARWQINSDGTATVRRYWSFVTDTFRCLPETFDPSPQDDCNLYNSRDWDTFAIKTVGGEERVYMLNKNQFFSDSYLRAVGSSVADHVMALEESGERYWLKLTERPVDVSAALDAINTVTESQQPETVQHIIADELAREAPTPLNQ